MVSVLLIAGAATPWLIQRQSEIKLREENRSLRTQLDQLSQQRTEDERPPNLLAQAGGPLPDDQLRELLKLRGEVGSLRKQTNELLKLQAQNRQLRSEQASGRAQRQPNLAAGDSVPVESMAFAGYATPEATFESTLSAHVKNDMKTLFEGFTPERRQEEEQKFAGKSEVELAAQAAEHAAHFAGADARILKSRLVSQDEAELVVFLGAKENEVVTITTKRIAGEWKISRERH
jgi:hypothetical protein